MVVKPPLGIYLRGPKGTITPEFSRDPIRPYPAICVESQVLEAERLVDEAVSPAFDRVDKQVHRPDVT